MRNSLDTLFYSIFVRVGKQYGGEDQKFAMKVLKTFQTQTFKKSKSSFAKYLK